MPTLPNYYLQTVPFILLRYDIFLMKYFPLDFCDNILVDFSSQHNKICWGYMFVRKVLRPKCSIHRMSEWQRAFAILGGSEQLFRICRTSPSESLFVWQPQNSTAKRRFARSDPFLVPRQMPVLGDLGRRFHIGTLETLNVNHSA